MKAGRSPHRSGKPPPLPRGVRSFWPCALINVLFGFGDLFLDPTTAPTAAINYKALFGEPGGTRTHGPKIKSLVLYHLSYGLPRALQRQCVPRVNATGEGV
jgi:hypothetical protein